MKVEFDPESDALYLRLDEAKVIDSEQVAPGVIVDFDSQDRVVGLEVLALSRRLPKSKGRKVPPCLRHHSLRRSRQKNTMHKFF
jgi:uncharacterized protein YuzE